MVMICWVSISSCVRIERTTEKLGASADQVDLEKALAEPEAGWSIPVKRNRDVEVEQPLRFDLVP